MWVLGSFVWIIIAASMGWAIGLYLGGGWWSALGGFIAAVLGFLPAVKEARKNS